MKLYAITDGARISGDAMAVAAGLTGLASQWASEGVEFIQIRERQMSACALEQLARGMVAAVRDAQLGWATGAQTKVLINGRADVALAVGADGVHLPGAGALTPAEVRRLYAECARPAPVISVACHAIRDVERARDNGASMAVFAPVYAKVTRQDGDQQTGRQVTLPGLGLATLEEACKAAGSMPVFALGGVKMHNATACIEAGAAGVAGIRLFSAPGWQSLRQL